MDYAQAAEELMRLLHHARGGGIDMLHQHMKGEAFVLHVLSHTEGAALPGQLRSATCTSSARVAATLGSLEQKGFITREIDPADRRRILVRLTDEGRRAWETTHGALHGRLEGTLRALGEDDTRELLRLAARLAEIMRSEREDIA
ncbi:MAG: transcriptional regulator [Oscillospiraceae bacterium]|jgi:DNA-binding MarR family transcriptional regulator|nr:transcriptional regulator [Oscillospiraceae bacterium]